MPDRISGISNMRWSWDRIAQLFIPRRVPLEFPPKGIFDPPVYCAMVNGEWLSHLMGQIAVLAEYDSWSGTDEEIDNAVQQIEALMASLAEGCMLFLLRQNPSNPCQLEQSTDGGGTWSLAFDYSLCDTPSRTDQILVTNEISNYVQNLNVQYDGTVNSVDSDLLYDNSNKDRYRDMGLCIGCKTFVDAACEIELARRNGQLDSQQKIFDFVGVLETTLATVLGGGVLAAFAGAIITAIGDLIFAAIRSVNTAILSNTDARSDVTCCMYSAMQNATPTELLFQSSLNNCNFSPGSDSEIMRAAIAELLPYRDIYLTFLKCLGDGLDLAELGVTMNCDCATWTHTFLSGNGEPPYCDYGAGAYDIGSDTIVKDYTVNAPDGTAEMIVDMIFPEAILATKVNATFTTLSVILGYKTQELWILFGGIWSQVDTCSIATSGCTLSWLSQDVINGVRMIARCKSNNSPPYHANITGIHIEGIGYDPMEGYPP